MLSKQPRLVVTFVLLVVGVMGADQEGQGRQMNWNGIKSMSNKPAAFGNSNYLADVDAGSSMTAQAKSSANYQGLSSQSLDGTGDLNRDGPYSSGGGDYAYEPNYASDLSSGYHGYDYQRYLPTTSKPFYSVSNSVQAPLRPSSSSLSQFSSNGAPAPGMTVIPNAFLRGMPRDQQDHPISSLSSMQSGRISNNPAQMQQQMMMMTGLSNYSASNRAPSPRGNSNQAVESRAGYDEDIPLGGISSTSSGGLAGTSMRNPLSSLSSRQDDFSYGTVNGGYGYSSIPPAVGGAYGGAYGGGSAFGSPGYSSNYATPYAAAAVPNYASGYSGYPHGNFAGASPLYSNNYAASGGNGYGYGYAGYQAIVPSTAYYGKKPKKAFLDWFKLNKQIAPYSSYGYGGGAAAAVLPYDYYYDPPSFWHLSKFAFKSLFKSMFKPFFKWLPFCSPFLYYDRDDRA